METKNHLKCFKKDENRGKEAPLWEKTFDSIIDKFEYDPRCGDRINVWTQDGSLRGDSLKGNFSFITKRKHEPTPEPTGKQFKEISSIQLSSVTKNKKFTPKSVFSPNGRYYVAQTSEFELAGLKIDENLKGKDKIIWKKKLNSKIHFFDFHSRSNQLNIVTKTGILRGDVIKGNFSSYISGKKMHAIAFSGDGSIIAVSKGNDLTIHNYLSGNISLKIPKAYKKGTVLLALLAKGQLLTINKNGNIVVFDTQTGTKTRNQMTIDSRNGSIQAAALTADKKRIIIGVYDFSNTNMSRLGSLPNPTDIQEKSELKIYSSSNLKLDYKKRIIRGNIYFGNISISADGRFAAVVSRDKKNRNVIIWDLEFSNPYQTFSGKPYTDARFGPLGKSLILATQEREFIRYRTPGIRRGASPDYTRKKIKVLTPQEPLITKSQAGITIAVHNFSAGLTEPQLAKALSESFKSSIANYSYINVVERDKIEKVIKEQRLQLSGLTSPDNAVEIGKILNAQKIITGSVTHSNSTLTVTVTVIDTKNGRTEGAREVECRNFSIDDKMELIQTLLSVLIE